VLDNNMETSEQSAETAGINNKVAHTPLCVHVKRTMEIYFSQLSDHDAVNLHALVMGEVEKPLLEAALAHSDFNQTKAAKVLGLSRSTLRKKLAQYDIS